MGPPILFICWGLSGQTPTYLTHVTYPVARKSMSCAEISFNKYSGVQQVDNSENNTPKICSIIQQFQNFRANTNNDIYNF